MEMLYEYIYRCSVSDKDSIVCMCVVTDNKMNFALCLREEQLKLCLS